MDSQTIQVKIKCAYHELKNIDEIKESPDNTNTHSPAQIKKLAELMLQVGITRPISVSLRSGFIVAGVGRWLAMKELGLKQAPVDFLEFESEDAEFLARESDNHIARWARSSYKKLNAIIPRHGPEIGPKEIAAKRFKIEPADKYKKLNDLRCSKCGQLIKKGPESKYPDPISKGKNC